MSVTEPRLFDIHWPRGGPSGARLGYSGYASTPYYEPRHWLQAGYDGCRVYGHGARLESDSSTSTLLIESNGRHVELVEFDVHCGDPRAIYAGVLERDPLRVDLTRCRVLGPGKWGDFSFNRGGRRLSVVYDGSGGFGQENPTPRFVEHCDYSHGNDGRGSSFELCQFANAWGEGVKRVYRPWEGAYQGGRLPGKHAHIDRCRWHGRAPLLVKDSRFETLGAGVICQGSGEDVLIHGCVFRLEDHAIGIEGAPEFYKMDQDAGPQAVAGIPGLDFCNGRVTIERCLIMGTGQNPNVNLLFLAGCESLTVRECAVYGKGLVQIGTNRPQDKMGPVLWEGCNTPELRRLAEEQGGDTSVEPVMRGIFSGALEMRHEQ